MSKLLSPEQAAQAVSTSRWSIMRAIKAGRLRAVRDNQNVWRIAPEDLDAWKAAHRALTVPPVEAEPPAQVPAPPDEGLQAEVETLRIDLAVVRARVEAAEARAGAAEADRDAWRALAAQLASRPAPEPAPAPAQRWWSLRRA